MKKFKVLIVEDLEDGSKADVIFETDSLESVARLRSFALTLKSPASFVKSKPGAKGRPVMILGKSGDSESLVQAGDIFPTALEASYALGYGCNAVTVALRSAAVKGEETATLRGVELRYADTVGRID
jgi:hypothetical protein